MLEVYNCLFDQYLNSCKWMYEKEDKDLEDCCKYCGRCQYRLGGMLDLMEELREITTDQNWKEWDRIVNTFSTYKLFGCHLDEDNTVMVWRKAH